MNIKKILLFALVALVIYFVVMDPQTSADGVRGAVGWLRDGAQSLVVFLRSLFE